MFEFPVLLTSQIDLFLTLFILIRLEPTRLVTKLASHRQGGDLPRYITTSWDPVRADV